MSATPDLTEEDIRLAFIRDTEKFAGTPTPRKRPDNPDRMVAMRKGLEEWRKRPPQERPLSPKWYMIMTMQLRGLTFTDIASRIGCHLNSIANITKSPRYRAVLEARMKDLDTDLLVLKPKAIDALANALVSQNEDTALRGARTYFEMTGQGTFGKGQQDGADSTGAVALAKALVAEARASASVYIHVGSPPSEVHGDAVLVAGARAPDQVRSLHGEPPGRLLPSPQGDRREDAPTGDPNGGQPLGMEVHCGRTESRGCEDGEGASRGRIEEASSQSASPSGHPSRNSRLHWDTSI